MAARENRVWGPRERLVKRALGRLDVKRLGRALARAADVDRLAKGLRAPRADSDAWLELTEIALDVTH
jgi:DNA polymerase-3 subunit delta